MVNWWFGATCGLDSIAGIPFHKRILSESKAPGPKQNQCTISWIVMNKRNINLFFNRKKKMQFYFLRLNISPENEREYPHENQWGFKSTWNVPLFLGGHIRPISAKAPMLTSGEFGWSSKPLWRWEFLKERPGFKNPQGKPAFGKSLSLISRDDMFFWNPASLPQIRPGSQGGSS